MIDMSQIKKSECECQIKINIRLISDIINNIELNNFVNIKNKTNIEIIKCYKLLFSKDGLKNNIGNYVILSIIICTIICLVSFINKGFKSLLYIIDKILLNKINISNKKNKSIKKIRFLKKKNNKGRILTINKPKKNKKCINSLKSNEVIINSKSISITNIKSKNNLKDKINEEIGNTRNDYEINSLKYQEALKLDKRTYFEYYLSLLKRKQILVFTFYLDNDYNSRSIKICLFLFSFALSYTVNALFFNDSTMHKIYIDKGKYDFIYQISNILLSTIISIIITTIIKYLSLTETNIIEIKNNCNMKNMREKKKGLT